LKCVNESDLCVPLLDVLLIKVWPQKMTVIVGNKNK